MSRLSLGRPGSPSRLSGAWLAFALYVVLTIVMAYPLSTSPARLRIPSAPDPDLFLWTLAWDAHAFAHHPLSIFDANIYHPERRTLAYSENLIGSAVLAAPIIWLTGNLVLANNLVSLLACALCGLGAYLLGRRVGLGPAGAFLCGMIFAFAPTRFFRISQLHLGPVQWVPFSLAWLHAYLDGGKRRHLLLAIGGFTLQVFTSGHGAVFLAVAVSGLLAYRALLGEELAAARRLRDFGIAGVMLLLPCVLLSLPYFAVQHEMGLRRGIDDWGANRISFLASPAHFQVFVLSLFGQSRINDLADAYLFPGYLPVLLALAALTWQRRSVPAWPEPRPARRWRMLAMAMDLLALAMLIVSVMVIAQGPVKWRVNGMVVFSARSAFRALLFFGIAAALRVSLLRRVPIDPAGRIRRGIDVVRSWTGRMRRFAGRHRRDPTLYYALLAFVSFWLAVGPPFGLWQFVYWLPGLNFIREASRFTMLGVLALAVLSGIGFERLTRSFGPKTRFAGLGVAIILLVGEFAAMPLAVGPNDWSIPAVDRWLDRQPKPFAVAELPLPRPTLAGAFERRQTTYMLHSTAHFQKTVHGYSGLRPALHADLYWSLQTFPDRTSLGKLASLGVTYVVVHTELYPPGEWERVEERIATFREWLRLEHADGAGRVYSLHEPHVILAR